MEFEEALSIEEVLNIIKKEISIQFNLLNIPKEAITIELIRKSKEKIKRICSLRNPKKDSLVYVTNTKYLEKVREIKDIIVAVITNKKFEKHFDGISTIVSSHPKLCFASILNKAKKQDYSEGASENIRFLDKKSTQIDDNAKIGDFCFIGKNVKIGNNSVVLPFVYLGDNVVIGNNVIIYPNVTILNDVEVGNNVIIHSGARIGSDGFGYEQILIEGSNLLKHLKLTHIGKVIISDNVEIGANTCIDRAFIDETLIKQGTKIDNLVQIAHNVTINNDSMIMGQAGIAGSSTLGEQVALFGQVGVADNVRIGEKAIITAQSGVMSDIPDGRIKWAGSPAIHALGNWKNFVISETRLPALLSALEKSSSFEEFKKEFISKKR